MALDIVSYVLGKKAGGGGGSNYQSKSIEITENGTTNVTADSGYDALKNVNVTVSGILDTSDANAVASDMATGKTAYVNGTKITGNVPVGSSSVATNYASNNIGTYLDDLKVDTEQGNQNQMFRTGDKISVYAPLTDVAPVIGASAEKIKKNEVICGVTGTYEGNSEWDEIGWNSMPPSIESVYDITKTYYDNWNPSSPISQYFYGANTMEIAPGIDTHNLTTFLNFFYNCSRLTDVPSYDTTSNTTYRSMFQGCSALKSVDISSYSTTNFVVGQTGSFREMFSNCYNLEDINFGGFQTFDPSKTNNVYLMFNNCTKLSNNTLNDILELCVIITPNMGATEKKLSSLGINSSFDNWNNIENLSNYTAFRQAGWITA